MNDADVSNQEKKASVDSEEEKIQELLPSNDHTYFHSQLRYICLNGYSRNHIF